MSAAEVIEQIKTLPVDDLEEVAKFIQTFGKSAGSANPVTLSRGERFQKATDKVFTEHAELLRRLAQ